MPKRILLAAGVLLSGLFLFYLTVLIVMPADIIRRAITGPLQDGVRVESASFERAFPFGVKASGLQVVDARGARAVRLDELLVRYSPLSPFTGRLSGDIDGSIADGELTGRVSAAPGGVKLDLKAEKIPLGAFGPLADMGIDVTGAVTGHATVRKPYSGCAGGKVTAKGEGLKAGGIRVLGFGLPFGAVTGSGLELELTEEGGGACVAQLKGLWLEGEGLTARLSGTIHLKAPLQASELDLLLEVTPKGATVTKLGNMVFLMPYRRSANYYAVKVRGTLGAPRM